MKIVYKIALLETKEILVQGDYGSDYQPYTEYCNVIREFDDEFDDEPSAVSALPNYFDYGTE